MKIGEKKCPRCAEIIKVEARACKHCGHEFSQRDVESAKQRAADSQRNGAIGCVALIILILGISQCSPGPQEETKTETAGEQAAKQKEEAENVRKGFHCLSAWDGSNRSLTRQVKDALRNPDSFEHVETRIGPVTESGKHPIFMTYRAQNGFGGMNVESAAGMVDPSDCSAQIISAEEAR